MKVEPGSPEWEQQEKAFRDATTDEPFTATSIDDMELPVSVHDFYAFMPSHNYVFTPTRELWPAASVNARTPWVAGVKPSNWLDQHRPVDQMTWSPGMPMLIEGKLIADGGWIERAGCNCFNLYRPPVPSEGDPAHAGPWLEHLKSIYPDNAAHIINWLAHRVQRPSEKINHALVLGGDQGIGKDSLLEPVKHAIGPWNFSEVSPKQLLGRFNGFIKSVILRVSEARDLGEVDRYAFYDHMKSYTASPPDVLRCDEKHLKEHAVLNVCGVIITTNHKADGIHIPADDRRHYVAWSEYTKDDFPDGYWNTLWGWYRAGGLGHVAAYLAAHDLTSFDAKAPPRKTAAWFEIVDAGRAPEDAEFADVIDALNKPLAVTLTDILYVASESLQEWLKERRNRRTIPHRFEAVDYVPIRNDAARDGLWVISGRRQAIYARRELSVRDRLAAAATLVTRYSKTT